MHGTGRFMTERALSFGLGPMNTIRKELMKWINDMSDGWEALGAERGDSQKNAIGFKSVDDCGNDIFPITQREGFGNQFDDWCSD